ncbi:MAG: hypothetical protein V7K77_11940 [Nostoc sp.]|uniref:hypothetical protein n=1 Tax=Nostoc sp. TaxID=1180 RepID=UPI002FF67E52
MLHLNSLRIWFPVSLTLLGLGLAPQSAIAQNIYTFNSSYDTLSTSSLIVSDISEVNFSGQSTDAPYGLTKISGRTYSQANPTTGFFSFNADPTTFGLQNLPFGLITLEGNDNNRLFGIDSSTGTVDFETLVAKSSGTLTITGGSGKFSGATGTLAFSDINVLSTDTSIPFKGQAILSGSFQVVPEPNLNMALLLVSIGVGVRYFKTALSKSNVKK